MSIRDTFPLRKRRYSNGKQTPRRSNRLSFQGRLDSRVSLNESMNSSIDGEPEITWDNSSPSPRKCTRLASRIRKGGHVTDVSEIVKRLTVPCNGSPDSSNTDKPSTPTLLGLWMKKDGTEVNKAVDNSKKSIKATQTPVRRRNKRKVRSGRPASISSSQVTKYMRKLIEETEAHELMAKEDNEDAITDNGTAAVNNCNEQKDDEDDVILMDEDYDDDNDDERDTGADENEQKNLSQANNSVMEHDGNGSVDLFTDVNDEGDTVNDIAAIGITGNIENSRRSPAKKMIDERKSSRKNEGQNSSSQDELWDDDDFFYDDIVLRQATQIEMQCSQIQEKRPEELEDFTKNRKLVASTPLAHKTRSVTAASNSVVMIKQFSKTGNAHGVKTGKPAVTNTWQSRSSHSTDKITKPVTGKGLMTGNLSRTHQQPLTGKVASVNTMTKMQTRSFSPYGNQFVSKMQTRSGTPNGNKLVSVSKSVPHRSNQFQSNTINRNETGKSGIHSGLNNPATLSRPVQAGCNVPTTLVGNRTSVSHNRPLPGANIKSTSASNAKCTPNLQCKGQSSFVPKMNETTWKVTSSSSNYTDIGNGKTVQNAPKLNQLTTTANTLNTFTTDMQQLESKSRVTESNKTQPQSSTDYDLSLTKDDLLTLMEEDDSWDFEVCDALTTNKPETEAMKDSMQSTHQNYVKETTQKVTQQAKQLGTTQQQRNPVITNLDRNKISKTVAATHANTSSTATVTRRMMSTNTETIRNCQANSSITLSSVKPLGEFGKTSNTHGSRPIQQSNPVNKPKMDNNRNVKIKLSSSQDESSSQRYTAAEIERKKKAALQRRQQKIHLSQSTQLESKGPRTSSQGSSNSNGPRTSSQGSSNSNGPRTSSQGSNNSNTSTVNSQTQKKYSFRHIKTSSK
ncbi:uncharacterized protein LOC144453310 [Glandiceps talaboti]